MNNIIIAIISIAFFTPITIYLVGYPKLMDRKYIPMYKSKDGHYNIIVNVINKSAFIIKLINSKDFNNHNMIIMAVNDNDPRFIRPIGKVIKHSLYWGKNYIKSNYKSY